MPKDIEKIIINSMEEIFDKNYNKLVEFNFEIIENHVFLYIQVDNGTVMKKMPLQINPTYLNELYYSLYEEFKKKHLNSSSKKIKVNEVFDLSNIEDPYLTLNIRDVHKNIIQVELKSRGYAKEALEEIKKDFIEIVNNLKTSKNK